MAEKFTLFWHGPFSQWYLRDFTVNGTKYNCVEQYMMAEKAKLFKDHAVETQIMLADEPKEQKALGRQVKNFDAETWNTFAKSVVFQGNYAKFSQHPDLLELILATDGTTLVESSPRDRIWGIGLGPNNPDANDRSKWRGKNWLGEVLTDVRKRLLVDREIEEYKIEV